MCLLTDVGALEAAITELNELGDSARKAQAGHPRALAAADEADSASKITALCYRYAFQNWKDRPCKTVCISIACMYIACIVCIACMYTLSNHLCGYEALIFDPRNLRFRCLERASLCMLLPTPHRLQIFSEAEVQKSTWANN